MGATKLLPFVRHREASPPVYTSETVSRAAVVTLVDEAINRTLISRGDTPENRALLNVDALQHMARTVKLLASRTWEAQTRNGEQCGCAMVAAGRVTYYGPGEDVRGVDADAAQISTSFIAHYDDLALDAGWSKIVEVID